MMCFKASSALERMLGLVWLTRGTNMGRTRAGDNVLNKDAADKRIDISLSSIRLTKCVTTCVS